MGRLRALHPDVGSRVGWNLGFRSERLYGAGRPGVRFAPGSAARTVRLSSRKRTSQRSKLLTELGGERTFTLNRRAVSRVSPMSQFVSCETAGRDVAVGAWGSPPDACIGEPHARLDLFVGETPAMRATWGVARWWIRLTPHMRRAWRERKNRTADNTNQDTG